MKHVSATTVLVVTLLTLIGCTKPRNRQECIGGVIVYDNPCKGEVTIILDDNGNVIPCKPKLQTSTITEGH